MTIPIICDRIPEVARFVELYDIINIKGKTAKDISQLENKEHMDTTKVLKSITKVLKVALDDIAS